MRLGLALDLGSAAPVADQVAGALPLLRAAEESGVDTVWVGESYHRAPQPFHLPAALIVLAHLSAHTTLRLGTGVLLLRAYDPVRLGYETALVDQLSGGRLSVGLGLGPAELGERFGGGTTMTAALRALRSAWDGGAVPGPVSTPRLLVGGGTAASARRAAELADGYYAATNYSDRLLAHQAAAYRDHGATGDVVANRLCLIHEDGATARALAARYLSPVLDYYSGRGLWKSTPDDPAPGVSALVGTPADVATALHRYADAGVTAVNLRVAPHGTPCDVARRTIELAASWK
ncbi:LLM class flavin-dependent oxidoreductase [Actinophytocola sp. NPDC049390]|uniref:LLM class flavin-dependent oxidoreductase n=1 Tax=Actinophytocola sp. NPDC049390 TaxID=3363894 RepID=UPI0037B64E31